MSLLHEVAAKVVGRKYRIFLLQKIPKIVISTHRLEDSLFFFFFLPKLLLSVSPLLISPEEIRSLWWEKKLISTTASATTATPPSLLSTAKLTLPSSVSPATSKSTSPTNSSPNTSGHFSAIPVTTLPPPFSARPKGLCFARTATGNTTPALPLFIAGDPWKDFPAVRRWPSCWPSWGSMISVTKLCFLIPDLRSCCFGRHRRSLASTIWLLLAGRVTISGPWMFLLCLRYFITWFPFKDSILFCWYVLKYSQNRHATCGKHKDEMIRQLRELARSEPSCLKFEAIDAELDAGLQFLTHDNLFSTCQVREFSEVLVLSVFRRRFHDFSNLQVSGLKWFEGSADQQDEDFPYSSLLRNLSEESSVMVPVSDSLNRCEEETVMVPVTMPSHEINSLERNSALSRYKEKKKSRRLTQKTHLI